MSESNPDKAIRTVCVLGGGIVGLSAALAFARALPKARVSVVAPPPDPSALADRLPSTLPAVGRFHASLGVDELDLVRTGIATHRLATRFEHWSTDGGPWHHALGGSGASVGDSQFYKVWAKTRRAGQAAPFERHIPAAVLAAEEKFVHPDARPNSPLGTFLYALRLEPELYRAHLRAACDVQRVDRTEGEFGQVERRGDGGIAALLLKDGRRIEADLFLDCAGPSAPLLTAVGDSFEDWSAWLPADRLLLGELKGRRPSPVDGVEALDDGWRWTAPLAGKALVGFAYASAITDEQQARRVLEAGEMATIRTGRQRAPWVHNVLALGDAAVAVDPLEGVNLHLAQSAILRALELLPGRDCHPVELAEYNRRTDWATSRVRDFLALHYLRSGRREGCFWAELADRPPPETLALTLEQWERRGRLPFFEEESFDSDSWTAVLFGLGIMPRDVDPVADGVSLDQAVPAIARHAKSLAALAARLPAYPDYLEGMRRTPPPGQPQR